LTLQKGCNLTQLTHQKGCDLTQLTHQKGCNLTQLTHQKGCDLTQLTHQKGCNLTQLTHQKGRNLTQLTHQTARWHTMAILFAENESINQSPFVVHRPKDAYPRKDKKRLSIDDCDTRRTCFLNYALSRRLSRCCSVRVKVKYTLEQATRIQRGSRGIALLFL
jgi:hypothetical protein